MIPNFEFLCRNLSFCYIGIVQKEIKVKKSARLGVLRVLQAPHTMHNSNSLPVLTHTHLDGGPCITRAPCKGGNSNSLLVLTHTHNLDETIPGVLSTAQGV